MLLTMSIVKLSASITKFLTPPHKVYLPPTGEDVSLAKYGNVQLVLLPRWDGPVTFNHSIEVQTFATMKLITQLRRIRSLKRQLCKLQDYPLNNSRERALLQEWKAILSHPNFVPWCCNTPEIGPPPVYLPTVDLLHDIDQIMTYEVGQRVHAEAVLDKNKKEYARKLDRRFHGSSSAFSALRDAPSNYIETLSVDIEENGIVASYPSDDTLEIFVDRSKDFNMIDLSTSTLCFAGFLISRNIHW